jgi:hypothetical protein
LRYSRYCRYLLRLFINAFRSSTPHAVELSMRHLYRYAFSFVVTSWSFDTFLFTFGFVWNDSLFSLENALPSSSCDFVDGILHAYEIRFHFDGTSSMT